MAKRRVCEISCDCAGHAKDEDDPWSPRCVPCTQTLTDADVQRLLAAAGAAGWLVSDDGTGDRCPRCRWCP